MNPSKSKYFPKKEEPAHLWLDDEIEKLTLSAFYGAEFYRGGDVVEPPDEIENEWLRKIAHFEEKWENARQITVAEHLDNADFLPVDELSEEATTCFNIHYERDESDERDGHKITDGTGNVRLCRDEFGYWNIFFLANPGFAF